MALPNWMLRRRKGMTFEEAKQQALEGYLQLLHAHLKLGGTMGGGCSFCNLAVERCDQENAKHERPRYRDKCNHCAAQNACDERFTALSVAFSHYIKELWKVVNTIEGLVEHDRA